MKGKDEIRDLFSDKLSGYEAKVNPELWSNISANIGSTSTVASTGLTVFTKTIIGLSIVAATVTGIVLLTNESTTNTQSDIQPELSVIEKETNEADVNVEKKQQTVSLPEITEEISPASKKPQELVEDEKEVEIAVKNEELIVPLEEQGGRLVQEDDPLNDLKEKAQSVTIIDTETVVEEQITKEIDEETIVEESRTELVLSNIFSPNNDMSNDILFVESEGLMDFNIVVLNAQNKVVYQSNDPNFQWNGIGMDGMPVANGNYVYFVTARDKNGNPVNQHSPLTIVR